MQFSDFMGLLGGLALFLYGMQMMSGGLEAAAGDRMKQILEKLTSNRFLGVLVGAAITAVIQSSSATTVMVVGFVNSGMMSLQQAVWIIMGANIGTTITGQLIALDVGALAPALAFAGVALVVFVKNIQVQHWGQILAGLGVLFIGMDMMGDAMMPLRESEAFVSLMTRFSNPLLGILAGAVFTAIIQSSSASVGILQALARSGAISFASSVYVLFGQNIGTCITAVLASIGTGRNAKRTTVIHLTFNVIGTAVFTALCILTPLADWVASLTPGAPASQIANMHTLFNVTTTLLLLPFGTQLAALARRILPDTQAEEQEGFRLLYLPAPSASHDYRIGGSAILTNGLWREWLRMLSMVRENVQESFDAVLTGDLRLKANVEQREEYIDYLNHELAAYISRAVAFETNEQDSAFISALFKASSDLERIGDHAMNVCGYTAHLRAVKASFSEAARGEIRQMQAQCLAALDLVAQDGLSPADRLARIESAEQAVDDMTASFRQNQLARLRTGACSGEVCVLYSEMLTDFERIGDHVLNLGQELAGCRFLAPDAPHAAPAHA
ncbi:MAG TPA: Na/Pi cotransporter family protein [Candidatus Ruthenibacterium merdigallinarum]|nr:Na/Pi cotransporter family protein [Candidatus Ruthenibacterium merdigallinarum]